MSSSEQLLLADAQTSGGLLIAVDVEADPTAAERLVDELIASGAPESAVIGEVLPAKTGAPVIEVVA